MKKLLLAVALLAGTSATAATSQQIAKSKELPQTVVVRRSKANPADIAVIHSKEKISAGTKLSHKQFEKMALNAEVKGIAFDSGNELDARSSTSSWSFGVYYRPSYGYSNRSYNTPTYPSYGYDYGRDTSRDYNRGYDRSYDRDYDQDSSYRRPVARPAYRPYYPSYNYSGYRYRYQSYYNYSDNNYDYDYCSWNY